MNSYEAPSITARRELQGSLNGIRSELDSDAQIKHNIEPVTSYEAPSIIETTPLGGSLGQFRSLPT